MNKTEKVVLKGIRDSLYDVRGSVDGDSWETWANRMRTTIKTGLKILDGLLKMESVEDEDDEEEKLTL
jgi:hypothetical protein